MFRWRFGPQPGTNEKTEYEKRIETSGFFFFISSSMTMMSKSMT